MQLPQSQYVIDFENRDRTFKQIIEIFDAENVNHSDIDKKYTTNKKGQQELSIENDPTWAWTTSKWINYLIRKGFWIDCYTSYSSVYAGSQDLVIIHKL